MNEIELETITLCEFNKDDAAHLMFLKELLHDKSIKTRFQGILPNLMRKTNGSIYKKGFLVKDKEKYIGYIDVGNYNEEEKCVYLRETISSSERNKAYGTRLLSEISDYIFKGYPEVESIKVKVANDNKASLKMVGKCGYTWISDDYYGLSNPYINKKM